MHRQKENLERAARCVYHDHGDGQQNPPAAVLLADTPRNRTIGYVQQRRIPMDRLHDRLAHLCGDGYIGGARRGGVVSLQCGDDGSHVPSGASSAGLSRQGSARDLLVNTLPSQ